MDKTRSVSLASVLAALTAVGAYITIPLHPVPVTLQTFFTFVSAASFGWFIGCLSQITYILLGGIGFPVFAGGKSGFGVLLGPTGGYLVGFVVSAALIGYLVEIRSNPSLPWIFVSVLIGNITIYCFGVMHLLLWFKVGLREAFFIGLIPFIPGDVIKMFLASVVSFKVRKTFKDF